MQKASSRRQTLLASATRLASFSFSLASSAFDIAAARSAFSSTARAASRGSTYPPCRSSTFHTQVAQVEAGREKRCAARDKAATGSKEHAKELE